MTPEAAKQLVDTVIGMLAAFVVAIPICWYCVPRLLRPRVSTVSQPDGALAPVPAPVVVMSQHRRRAIRRRQIQGVRSSMQKVLRENQNLKLENQQLKTKLARKDDITEGQWKGIDLFLEAERAKKPLTRTGATLLLGRDKAVGLQAIRDREPLPEEIARAAPMPA